MTQPLPGWYAKGAGRWTDRAVFRAPSLAKARRREGSPAAVPPAVGSISVKAWPTAEGILIEYRMGRRVVLFSGVVIANLIAAYFCAQVFLPTLPTLPLLRWVNGFVSMLPDWAQVVLCCLVLGVGLYTFVWFGLAGLMGRESIEVGRTSVILRQRAGRWRLFEYVFDLNGVSNFRLVRDQDRRKVSEMSVLSVVNQPFWEDDGTLAFDFLDRPILFAEDVRLEAAEQVLAALFRHHPELASEDPWAGQVAGVTRS